jgi:hypothetical protein
MVEVRSANEGANEQRLKVPVLGLSWFVCIIVGGCASIFIGTRKCNAKRCTNFFTFSTTNQNQSKRSVHSVPEITRASLRRIGVQYIRIKKYVHNYLYNTFNISTG